MNPELLVCGALFAEPESAEALDTVLAAALVPALDAVLVADRFWLFSRCCDFSGAFACDLAPRVSLRPGWISEGLSPTRSRLSWYSFFQPPRTLCSSAILER